MSTKINSYNRTARVFHWLMAALILAMLFTGVVIASISSPERQLLLTIHKSIGILVFILGVARLAWRFLSTSPPTPKEEPFWRQLAAAGTHFAFYILILTMPLVGWMMQTAAGYPVPLFGGLHLPQIIPQNGELHAFLRAAHRIGGYAFYGLFLFHLSAALFHALVLKDDALQRMGLNQMKSSKATGDHTSL